MKEEPEYSYAEEYAKQQLWFQGVVGIIVILSLLYWLLSSLLS